MLFPRQRYIGVHNRPGGGVCGIPQLAVEVESKKITIQETILSMISQFHMLHCFDDLMYWIQLSNYW